LVPTLLFDKALMSFSKITVNMGAVPHICNGADLMAPGIVKIEGNFNTNDYVLVVDERHQKPLAIAIALLGSQDARNLQRGKVAKNLHYVGDDLWKQLKKA
jgi:PUA domain protein